MAVIYPRHLYIRIDRPMRDALVATAAAQSCTVSDLARQYLRDSIERAAGNEAPSAAPAAQQIPAIKRARGL